MEEEKKKLFTKKEKPATKICKHCRTEIPYEAKVCPQCRKKVKRNFIIPIIIVILLFAFIGSLTDDEESKQVSEESKAMSEADFKKACKKIDYDDLFRNNDKHIGKKFKIKGEVQQVVYDNDTSAEYLVAITNDEFLWTDNVHVIFNKTGSETKILEDDIIVMYGECTGTYKYTSIFGESIEIPEISALYIDIKNDKKDE